VATERVKTYNNAVKKSEKRASVDLRVVWFEMCGGYLLSEGRETYGYVSQHTYLEHNNKASVRKGRPVG
jgi:hypothetical protein